MLSMDSKIGTLFSASVPLSQSILKHATTTRPAHLCFHFGAQHKKKEEYFAQRSHHIFPKQNGVFEETQNPASFPSIPFPVNAKRVCGYIS
jgi:hypothetical protein